MDLICYKLTQVKVFEEHLQTLENNTINSLVRNQSAGANAGRISGLLAAALQSSSDELARISRYTCTLGF